MNFTSGMFTTTLLAVCNATYMYMYAYAVLSETTTNTTVKYVKWSLLKYKCTIAKTMKGLFWIINVVDEESKVNHIDGPTHPFLN